MEEGWDRGFYNLAHVYRFSFVFKDLFFNFPGERVGDHTIGHFLPMTQIFDP